MGGQHRTPVDCTLHHAGSNLVSQAAHHRLSQHSSTGGTEQADLAACYLRLREEEVQGQLEIVEIIFVSRIPTIFPVEIQGEGNKAITS